MSNYGGMQSQIADELARADLTAHIQKAIQTAIQRHERTPFYFNRKTSTFLTVADQEYYGAAALADIPTLVEIDSMTVDVNGIDSPVVPIDFVEIDAVQTGTIKGTPQVYAYYGQQIRLYPIPDAARTATMSFVYRFASLSLSGDSNAWTTDAEPLIRSEAKAELYDHVIRSPEMADRMRALAGLALRDLLLETARRQQARRLVTRLPVRRGSFNIVSGR